VSHPRSTPDVASGRNSRISRRTYELQLTLQARLAQIAHRLRCSVPALDRGERQFLRDLDRKEARYPMRALVRLTHIAARSTLDHHREALPQLVHELITAQRTDVEPLDVDAAFDRETEAQAEFDKAQRAYDHAPTPANHARAIAAGQMQLTWTKASLDSLYATPPAQ
jgi:hypothetical protein